MKRIAIFASGAGSNAQKIIEHFTNHSSIAVVLVVCNKPGEGVISIAQQNEIPILIIEKNQFFRGDHYLNELHHHHVDFLVLAGFLWKIPVALIEAFPQKILNIHPSLLPKYGGKGMYGNKVHEAVINAGETESGITIHVVDEIYDNGQIIFSAQCTVLAGDTPETLAARIHLLEHEYYSKVIEEYLESFG